MSEQENLQSVIQGYQQFGQGDLEAVLSNFADDAELINPSLKEVIPHAGRSRGKEQIRQYFTLTNELSTFERMEPTDFMAQGDKVVVLGAASVRVKATGKLIETDFAHVFTLRDGKTVKLQVFDDSAQVAAAHA